MRLSATSVLLFLCAATATLAAGPADPAPGPGLAEYAASLETASGQWSVYFLEAPLLKSKVGDAFGQMFDAYHAGVGFHNAGSKEEFMVEFNAMDGLNLAKVFPEVTGSGLTWHKHGEVKDHEKMDPYGGTYWTKYAHIATVEASLVTSFKEWVRVYQKNVPEYQIFGLRDQNGKVLISSHTCYDFAFTAVDKLAELGATLLKSDQQRDVFDLQIHGPTLHKVPLEEEEAFWRKVYSDLDQAKLLAENGLAKAVGDIGKALKEKSHEGHPQLQYTIGGQPWAFRPTGSRPVVFGYTKQAIPSSGAAGNAETAVYETRQA